MFFGWDNRVNIYIYILSIFFLCAEVLSGGSIEEISPQISFCIADLKFDGDRLKICEFGQGVYSTFRGYDALHGPGKMWALVWEYLAQFKKPIWFVSPRLNDENIQEIACNDFKKIGGRTFRSLLELQNDAEFKQASEQKADKKDKIKISDYSGFLIIRKKMDSLQNFIKQHQNILVLDQTSAGVVGNKYLTHLLFDGDNDLIGYRPHCRVCNKRNCSAQINDIFRFMPAARYVIKPIASSMGRGIVIVENDLLQEALTCVVGKKKELPILQDSEIDYWQADKEETFLVEEFVESLPVHVNNKWYDPTMRVAFIVIVEDNLPLVTFLDAYWKLPAKAISEGGTITETHKSHIVNDGQSSCLVDRDDYKLVTMILGAVLPKVFKKMYSIEMKEAAKKVRQSFIKRRLNR